MCSSSGELDQLYMISDWKQLVLLHFLLGLLTFYGKYATICLSMLLKIDQTF